MPHTNNLVCLEGRLASKPQVSNKSCKKGRAKEPPAVANLEVFNPYARALSFKIPIMAYKSAKERIMRRFTKGDWMTVVGRIAPAKFKGKHKLVIYADHIGWMSNEAVDKREFSWKRAQAYEEHLESVQNMEEMVREEEGDDFMDFMDDGWGEDEDNGD